MLKRILIVGLALVMLAGSAAPVVAGGDKVRGERGQGEVAQHHESWCGYECRP